MCVGGEWCAGPAALSDPALLGLLLRGVLFCSLLCSVLLLALVDAMLLRLLLLWLCRSCCCCCCCCERSIAARSQIHSPTIHDRGWKRRRQGRMQVLFLGDSCHVAVTPDPRRGRRSGASAAHCPQQREEGEGERRERRGNKHGATRPSPVARIDRVALA